jgi:hypothetical protein
VTDEAQQLLERSVLLRAGEGWRREGSGIEARGWTMHDATRAWLKLQCERITAERQRAAVRVVASSTQLVRPSGSLTWSQPAFRARISSRVPYGTGPIALEAVAGSPLFWNARTIQGRAGDRPILARPCADQSNLGPNRRPSVRGARSDAEPQRGNALLVRRWIDGILVHQWALNEQVASLSLTRKSWLIEQWREVDLSDCAGNKHASASTCACARTHYSVAPAACESATDASAAGAGDTRAAGRPASDAAAACRQSRDPETGRRQSRDPDIGERRVRWNGHAARHTHNSGATALGSCRGICRDTPDPPNARAGALRSYKRSARAGRDRPRPVSTEADDADVGGRSEVTLR